jgi:hypothetical protein
MYKISLSGVLEEYYEIDLKIAGCMPQQKKFTNYLSRMGR